MFDDKTADECLIRLNALKEHLKEELKEPVSHDVISEQIASVGFLIGCLTLEKNRPLA